MPRNYGSRGSGGGREGIALLWRSQRFKLLGCKEVVFREMLPVRTSPGEGEHNSRPAGVQNEQGCCNLHRFLVRGWVCLI
jgi:hypothetical protein